MLNFLSELFYSFYNFIIGIFNLLMAFVGGIGTIINMLFGFVNSIPSYFFWLPSEVVSVVIATFGVVVLYKVLGREG